MAPIFLLFCIALTTIVFLVIFSKTKKSRLIFNQLPPGKKGWPILGETLDLISNPPKFIRDRMMKHNPNIFQTSFGGENWVIFCGPLGNKFVYSNVTKLRPWLPRSVTNAFSLKNTDRSTSSWKLYMEQLHKFFKLESLQDYVPKMDKKARKHLEQHWVPYDEVKVEPLSREFFLSLACHLIIDCSENSARELFEPFYTLADRLLSLPVNLPGTSYSQAMKASKIVQRKLIDLIRRRRSELLSSKADNMDIDGQDVLSRVLIASEKDGITTNDEELAGQIIAVLFGGFHTTSTAITFAVDYLAQYPDVYTKVLQEQLEISRSKRKGELLTWNDIQKMKYLWNVVCEAMRLRPPALGGTREAASEISYAGFIIPKGWKVHWNVNSTHMDPTYFPNPEKFDPSRFEKRLPPRVFVPFGGGTYMCLGREYARIKILVFLHNVVTRFRLTKVNIDENIAYKPHPIPVKGLRIRLHPHEAY